MKEIPVETELSALSKSLEGASEETGCESKVQK